MSVADLRWLDSCIIRSAFDRFDFANALTYSLPMLQDVELRKMSIRGEIGLLQSLRPYLGLSHLTPRNQTKVLR